MNEWERRYKDALLQTEVAMKINDRLIDTKVKLKKEIINLKKDINNERAKNNEQFEMLSYLKENDIDGYEWLMDNYKR